MEKTLNIFGKEVRTKGGKSFVEYSYVSKSGEWFKVKFKKECDGKPSNVGYYTLVVDTKDFSIAKGKKLDNGKNSNSTIWVHTLISCTKDIAKDKELEEKREREKESI